MSDDELLDAIWKIDEIACNIDFCKNLPECVAKMDEGMELDEHMCKACFLEYFNTEV
jgi:hypothetical protein